MATQHYVAIHILELTLVLKYVACVLKMVKKLSVQSFSPLMVMLLAMLKSPIINLVPEDLKTQNINIISMHYSKENENMLNIREEITVILAGCATSII